MDVTEAAFLLDSNICIYVLDGDDRHAALRQRLEGHPPGSIVTSAVGAAEVMRGRKGTLTDHGERVGAFFAMFPIQPFDGAAARRFADVPSRRGGFDRLIAAHALALDLTLVTNNERDFADIPGLRVENWLV